MKRKDTSFLWGENGSINNFNDTEQGIGFVPNTQGNADDVNFPVNNLDQFVNDTNDELFNILDAEGIVPDELETDQVLEALDSRFAVKATESKVVDGIMYITHTTAGSGGTAAAGLQTRTLNTQNYNDITGASLDTVTSIITLPAGKYTVNGSSFTYDTALTSCQLTDVSDSTIYVKGISSVTSITNATSETSNINGVFTLGTSRTIRLLHFCQNSRATDGFGRDANDGSDNVYASLIFTKIG